MGDDAEAWGMAAVAAIDHDPDEEAAAVKIQATIRGQQARAQRADATTEAVPAEPVEEVEEVYSDDVGSAVPSEVAEEEDAAPSAVEEQLDAEADVPPPEVAEQPEEAPAEEMPEEVVEDEVPVARDSTPPASVPEPSAVVEEVPLPLPLLVTPAPAPIAPTAQAAEPGPRQPSPAPLVVKSTLKGPPVATKDTSLHKCAKEGDAAKLKAALEIMGSAEVISSLTAQDKVDGWTPLHYAAVNRSTASLELLLAAGKGNAEVLDARSKEGQTALHFAVVWECPEHVKLLLAAGADVDARNEFEATPLHWACERGAHDVMRLLLDHTPAANTELVDDCGRTPLHVATENDMLREAMMLVKECGVRVDCRDRRGRTPIGKCTRNPRTTWSPEGVSERSPCGVYGSIVRSSPEHRLWLQSWHQRRSVASLSRYARPQSPPQLDSLTKTADNSINRYKNSVNQYKNSTTTVQKQCKTVQKQYKNSAYSYYKSMQTVWLSLTGCSCFQACGLATLTGSETSTAVGDLDVEFYEWVSANGLQAYIGTFRSHA